MQERLRLAWKIFLAAALAAVAWHPVEEVDVFFHLYLGEAVLRHGSRVVPEPAAFPDFDAFCLVPAWLWDVAAHGLHRLGGVNALLAATVLLSGALGWSLCRLVERLERGRSLAAFVWVSGMAGVCVAHRLQVRPQVAFYLILTLFLCLCLDYVGSFGRTRAWKGGAIVALSLLWAQIHGSFVLALAVFVLMVAERAWAARDDADERRGHLLVLAGVLLALPASAAGLDVLHYLTSHASEDLSGHNLEMSRVDWASVSPFGPSVAAGLLGLWVVSIAGLRDRAGWHLPQALLALLGVVLFSRVLRLSSMAALLAIPVAVEGACQLAEAGRRAYRGRLGWLGVGVAGVLVALLLWRRAEAAFAHAGPFSRGGWAAGAHPRAAARYLTGALPQGSRVLSEYEAGPPLAFWSDQRLRTFVDGRTPMFFDASDFALSRDVFHFADALWRAARRYGVRAVVIRRAQGTCPAVAEHWVPAVVEPRYTTFVPPGLGAPMAGLQPCGDELLTRDVCEDGGSGLSASAARLEHLGTPGFADQLRAAVSVRCGQDAEAALARLPEDARVWESRQLSRRLRIEGWLLQGRTEAAVRAMHQALDDGDGGVVSLLARPGARNLNETQRRGFLEHALRGLGDEARPGLRLALAAACLAQKDAACVREQVTRAALRGDERARPLLQWLSRHHRVPRVRDDARAWLRALE